MENAELEKGFDQYVVATNNEMKLLNEFELEMTAQNEYIPEDMFEEDSLTYLLGYTAQKFKSKYQDLVGNSATNEWIQAKSFGTLTQPSSILISVGKIIEKLFKQLNGKDDLKKTPGLITELLELTKQQVHDMMIEDEVLRSMIRTRIYLRIRELNKKEKDQLIDKQKHKKIQKFIK